MQTNEQLLSAIENFLAQAEFPAEPERLYAPIGYSLAGGGKRLRPMLLMLANGIFTDKIQHALPAAAAVEVFHNFTLLHDDERAAFASQVATLGKDTTLLVDTYDIAQGIRNAIAVAGPELRAVRIDSGDLAVIAQQSRELLDSLGATETKIIVSGDLDEYAIAALAASPVDSYGVGTSVVTGSGTPTAGMVYKLVARQDSAGGWVAVAKASTDKASKGGRKAAFRTLHRGTATSELIVVSDGFEDVAAAASHPDARPLQVALMTDGEPDGAFEGHEGVEAAREHHAFAREELPVRGLALSKSDPAIPTVYADAADSAHLASDS